MDCGPVYQGFPATLASLSAASLTATADKWIDVPAASATSNTDPIGLWDMPSSEYIRTNTNNHEKLIEIPVRAGDILDELRAQIYGEGINDGGVAYLVKRAYAAATWTAIDTTGAATGVGFTTLSATFPNETVLEGTVYAVRIVSVVGTTAMRIYSAGIHTTSRSL